MVLHPLEQVDVDSIHLGVCVGGGAEHTERGFSVDGQLLSSPRHWPYTKALGLNPNFHSAVGILEQNS